MDLKIVFYYDGHTSKILKDHTVLTVQATETQSKCSFLPKKTTSTRNENALTYRNKFACKNVRKITITYSSFRNYDENPSNFSSV